MYTYDSASRVLKIQQVPEGQMELELVQYQKSSYKQFCEHTIYDLLQMFIDKLSEKINHKVKVVGKGFRTSTPPVSNWRREMRVMPDRYIPILVDLDIDGPIHEGVEIFRLPFMDDDGVLNIGGERRICPLQLTAADGISYDGEGHLSISIPMRNISISNKSTGASVRLGQRKIPMADITRMYCAKELPGLNLMDVFVSAPLRAQLVAEGDADYSSFVAKLSSTNLYNVYHSSAYSLGAARDSLNRALSLDRALGRQLSRDIVANDGTMVGKVGDVVTDTMLSQIRKHLVNSIYVKAIPAVVGYKISGVANVLIINTLEAGTPVSKLILPYLPESMRKEYVIRKRIVYTGILGQEGETDTCLYLKEDPIIIDTSAPITEDLITLLAYCDDTPFRVARTGENWFDVTFEEEIIGNCTVQLRDVYGIDIPDGREADEWVYYHNNPDLKPTDNDYLNVHDWIALMNLCDYIQRHPNEQQLVDKDQGMLKRVLGPNELFAKAFEEALPSVFRQKSAAWTKTADNASSMNIDLSILFREWKRVAWASNTLVAANYQNPVIHTQQVNIIDAAAGIKETPKAMRMLSTGYYGRICPYETPMGKRLGLTNTRALGARIDPKTGMIKTPYVRVIHEGGKRCRISDDKRLIRYMTVQEEVRYKIGDRLSLKYDDDTGYFSNSKVVARVPDGRNGHTIQTIDSYELDYVNLNSNQHLSATAALQPFVGATDSARMTLGTGMIKQSILVQHNEKPRVYTSMYHRMFEHSTTYCARCKEAGIVIDVMSDSVIVAQPPADSKWKPGYTPSDMEIRQLLDYSVEWPKQEYHVHATTITRQSINVINYHVHPGQWVSEGAILYDSAIVKDGIYSPGCNFFVAYIPDGYNYEDAVEMSESAAHRFTSVSLETVPIKLPFRKNHTQPAVNPYVNHYVHENGVLAEFSCEDEKTLKYRATSAMHSGMVLAVSHNRDEISTYSRYTAYMVAFNTLRTGDKVIGRHSNKGTASIIRKNSEMPRFLNGQTIDVVLNPMGVPSRLNIGQNYEGYLGFVAYLLDITIESDSFNGATRGDIKELMHYVYDLANATDPRAVTSKYIGLPIPLRMVGEERFDFIRQWKGCFNPDGTAYLINPASGKPYANPVTFGVPYMLKLEHEVNRKIKVRAGEMEEEYSKIYHQPTEGAARGGGERVGEMEFGVLAAYGADAFMDETMNASSDNLIERFYSTMQDLGYVGDIRPRDSDSYFDRATAVPHSVEHLRYLLETLGISMDAPFLPDVTDDKASRRAIPDKRSIISQPKQDDSVAQSDENNEVFGMLTEGGTGEA